MPKGFLPNKDSELLAWSKNFSGRVLAEPAVYGISAELAAQLADVQAAWEAAYVTASEPATRTRPAVAAKDDARATLRELAGRLSRIISGQPAVSDAQKIELGLNVRKSYTRVARPTTAPAVFANTLYGRTFRIRLREHHYSGRGLPPGVAGANLYYCAGEQVGETPAWIRLTATTRADLAVELPADIAPGSRVWFVAEWFNPRQETGPLSRAAGAWVQFGGMQLAASLKAA